MELLPTNDAYNGLVHRKHLTQIVLNSWHNYGTDSPYRDTCLLSVDSMLQKWADENERWNNEVDIKGLQDYTRQARQIENLCYITNKMKYSQNIKMTV